MTHKNWLAEIFKPFGGVQDFGFDIDLAEARGTYWWAPGAWVASAHKSGATLPLLSCGPRWLDSLPGHYLGRDVRTVPLRELPNDVTYPLFLKLPEAKVDSCPARVFDTPRMADAWRQFGFDEWTLVQRQDVMDFVTEARFFIAEGALTASSLYRHRDWAWGADEKPSSLSEQMAMMTKMVAALLDDPRVSFPSGFVIDAGITSGGEVYVVEANAAWSSNPYGADPAGVVAAIKASHDFGDAHRKWRLRYVGNPLWDVARPLKVVAPAR
ncbi:ATP-grasp domain-containing protein [Mycobacteroides abscessus]|uniref:ATP-grasp domain-containing protein n=1 Tax=Mycobacteroides abscessus TaxID=36809 RepID=UPI0013001193|nr:ATP-grasp domain-containing protein [Mycobacteroides abscessus]